MIPSPSPPGESSASAEAGHRYEVLDALRGVCALAVAFFHYAAASAGGHWSFTGGSWLFVDFFFVLSGLVIAASYGEKLASGYRMSDFMILRIGRVYPLHVAVLAAMVAMELVALAMNQNGTLARPAFSGPRSPEALLGSLALVNIFGIWPKLVWNAPSWSIAAEVWAYLAFAIVCVAARQRFVAVMTCLAIAMGFWIAVNGDPWLNRTFWGSLPRCLFGFGLGALGWRVLHHAPPLRLSQTAMTALEALIVVLCVSFVATAGEGPMTLLAPPLFLVSILVFARESGLLSQVLLTAPMRWLGLLSYSIYMTHTFVLARLGDVMKVLQGKLGLTIVAPCPTGECFVATGMAGVVMQALFVVLLLCVSWISWRLVEQPGRIWSRRLVRRRQQARGQTR